MFQTIGPVTPTQEISLLAAMAPQIIRHPVALVSSNGQAAFFAWTAHFICLVRIIGQDPFPGVNFFGAKPFSL
jgi:hypothetical protein